MLDPLNDLVERFSDLMLMASVAFGVQLLLLDMGVHWGMSLLLSLAAGQQGIEQASQALGALAPDGGAADRKWWQLDKHIGQLGATIDKTVEHAIRLIVVFLLQTLILPLAVFWILLRTSRMLAAAGAGN